MYTALIVSNGQSKVFFQAWISRLRPKTSDIKIISLSSFMYISLHFLSCTYMLNLHTNNFMPFYVVCISVDGNNDAD